MEQMWGYPHALSHEGLRAINEFAEAELTAMVINGKSGGSHRTPIDRYPEAESQRRFGVNLM